MVSSIRLPEDLRAITIHAPYAYAIVTGQKPEEYRAWPTSIRGWVLIHAGLSKDSDFEWEVLKDVPRQRSSLYGSILGAAEVTGCEFWEKGQCYAHILENSIRFTTPISGVKGQLNYWTAKSQNIAKFDEARQRVTNGEWKEAKYKISRNAYREN